MGQVIFLNTNYKPSEAEKIQFHYLQSATNNLRKAIEKSEVNIDFQKYRFQLTVQARRSKMKLVDSLCEET